MRLIEPYRICHLVGHDRESYVAGHYFDRRGRERQRIYRRCKRCGTSDGGEVYREGLLERFTWWRVRGKLFETRDRLRQWWQQDCPVCGLRSRSMGRSVGNHEACDLIPF